MKHNHAVWAQVLNWCIIVRFNKMFKLIDPIWYVLLKNTCLIIYVFILSFKKYSRQMFWHYMFSHRSVLNGTFKAVPFIIHNYDKERVWWLRIQSDDKKLVHTNKHQIKYKYKHWNLILDILWHTRLFRQIITANQFVCTVCDRTDDSKKKKIYMHPNYMYYEYHTCI